jgi:RNA polymerase sigma-70 factor (ECF subfamily)
VTIIENRHRRRDGAPPGGPAEGASDHDIIATAVAEPDAFALLFHRHARELHGYLSRRVGELADDLLGELFLTAFSRRAAYRPDMADARPWLYGIASNLVRRHHRAEAARLRALGRLPLPAPAGEFETAAVARIDSVRLRPRLADALRSVKAADRDVLLLFAWTDLTQAEIATALALPPGTVRSRLHRARTQVKAALGADLRGLRDHPDHLDHPDHPDDTDLADPEGRA